MSTRILVCGGRDFSNHNYLFGFLDALDAAVGVTEVIEGGARGADHIARLWARGRDKKLIEVPADWKRHGRAAGPIRNEQMLVDYEPDKVIAFPGGRGTANMVRLAKDFGVEVIEVLPSISFWGGDTDVRP